MRAVVLTGRDPNVELVLGDVEGPGPPKARDVLVQVHAASVNPKDWKLNRRLAKLATRLRMGPRPIFGDDLAGVVVDRGRQVRHFDIGDAVYGMDMRLRTASLGELARIGEQRIARKPASLSFREAAAMPLAALTALQGLNKGHGGPGRSVLIIGASGGVGTFAVQIAKDVGMHVTGVCSGRNVELVQGLGADAVIDYTRGDYRRDAGPFDLVFDVTSYETPLTCARLLRPGGRFISTGGDFPSMVGTPLYRALGKRSGTVVVESRRRDLETLAEMVERGALHPVIDSVFPLEQTEQAYQRSRSGRCRGKVVIDVSPRATET